MLVVVVSRETFGCITYKIYKLYKANILLR